jgi:hypothetical protein
MIRIEKCETQTIVHLIRPRVSGVVTSAYSRSEPFFSSQVR